MSNTSPAPLPEPLKYLQPFIDAISTLPPDELDEDLDTSMLVDALRQRIAGLSGGAARAALIKDRELLQQWLEDPAHVRHPAHWIAGYLMSPGLGRLTKYLLNPSPPVRGPQITFDPPDGWEIERSEYGGLTLTKQKMFAMVGVLDESSFEHLQMTFAQSVMHPPHIKVIQSVSLVAFGDSRGKKYLNRFDGEMAWKQVHYLLSVPGGLIYATAGTLSGAEFDESPFEARLHTLRVGEPRG